MDHPGPEEDDDPPPVTTRKAFSMAVGGGIGLCGWYLLLFGIVRWLLTGWLF